MYAMQFSTNDQRHVGQEIARFIFPVGLYAGTLRWIGIKLSPEIASQVMTELLLVV
jgi:hypothetical protein